MPPPRFALAVLALPLLAVTARADDEEQRTAHKLEVSQFGFAVNEATTTGLFNGFYEDPAKCTKAVEAGTAAGVTPTDTFTGGDGNPLMWKHAGEVCASYARLHTLRDVITAIHPAMETITAFRLSAQTPELGATGDAYRATVAQVKTCVDTVDKAIKAGVPTDVKFAPNDNQGDTLITLTEARAQCVEYVGWGSKEATDDDARVAKELAAKTAKYTKLGITGDRLKYLIANDHHPIWGKGCSELSPKGLKTSPVFYDLGQDDLAWIVYKTQFKKDKQIKYTQRRFRKDGDYQCK